MRSNVTTQKKHNSLDKISEMIHINQRYQQSNFGQKVQISRCDQLFKTHLSTVFSSFNQKYYKINKQIEISTKFTIRGRIIKSKRKVVNVKIIIISVFAKKPFQKIGKILITFEILNLSKYCCAGIGFEDITKKYYYQQTGIGREYLIQSSESYLIRNDGTSFSDDNKVVNCKQSSFTFLIMISQLLKQVLKINTLNGLKRIIHKQLLQSSNILKVV
ncbi:unnamed protein product [Paramecium octaurelia]|uniref:Uncharacterized protein n=1 Tax=Paramecium octaurelia TaxID=43137 RepID=A0A8S1THC5_PAROT|nr:unnamed protein product [Paramecium octaurelia]